MCGILCTSIGFSKSDIEKCTLLLHNRGPDFSIISSIDNNFWITVTQLMIVGEDRFPIRYEKYSIIGNIEIYNYKDLYFDNFKEKFLWQKNYSDAHIILPIFVESINKGLSNETAFINLLKQLEYDFALIIYNNKGDLFIARDSLGIRPLYYAFSSEFKWAFCSEVKPLFNLGFKSLEINEVPPGYFTILNTKFISKSIIWEQHPLCINNFIKLRDKSTINTVSKNFKHKVEELSTLLLKAVEIRVPRQKFSLFLSGGIDSSLLLGLLLKIIPQKQLNIVSVGYSNSTDLLNSRKLCEYLNIELIEVILNDDLMKKSMPIVKKLLLPRFQMNNKKELSAVEISIALPLFFASSKAKKIGDKVAFSGQAADELFIGYKKYFELEYRSDIQKLKKFLNDDLIKLSNQNLNRDDIISMYSSIEIRYPYLDLNVIQWVMQQEISLLYTNTELRKQILRDVAAEIGLPKFILERKKKAAQYGSNVMKYIKKESKSFDSISDYIFSI